MKTKQLFLCMLFLLLSTQAAWADKYYMPESYKGGSNPRYTTLADAVGQKVMIYNAGLNGGVDYTGFLYVDGEGIAFDKCKERDLYVHNECYVYTVEGFDTDTDGNYDYYALKSLSTGTYIDFNGNLSTTVAPLYISTYSACGSKFADNVEEYGYGVTLVDKITEGTAVFAVSDNGGNYWCGGESSFATGATAAPFALYRTYEVTQGDYLQDLHIYSRSDVFSAQKIYGLALSGSSISVYPAADASLEYLVDGEYSTSVTTTGSSTEQHYLQFTLNKTTDKIYIYLKRKADATNVPEYIDVYAQPSGSGFTSVQSQIETGLGSNKEFYSAAIALTGIDNPVAIQIRNSATGEPMSFSEAYILPVRDEVTDAFIYFKDPVSLKSSAAQYTDEVADNNKNNPDVKLLSGVPLAGNKYRIYADAYTDGAYVNRDIRTNSSDKLVANEQYLTADAADLDYYHWYCEQVEGGLAFKNVETGKYLTLNGTQDAVYTWTFNTVLTHRHGVPLKNGSGEYLTLHNDGGIFETGVKSVFDQTLTGTQIKGVDTTDDTTDDEMVAVGVCSDYVFLPVDRTATEKKITFTANELVKRNSTFVWNGAEYTLPFSRIFVSGDADPVLTLNCPETHDFDGFYIKNTASAAYTNSGDVYTFDIDNTTVADNAVVEIRYSFTTVEDYSKNGKFYYICNLQEQAAAQQAGMQRTSIGVGTGQTSQNSTFSYYAAFDSKSTNMTLVGHSGIDAASLFYFTSVERGENNDYDQVYINNVLTTAKCHSANEWTDGGALYYLQPNAVADDSETLQGYSISRTKLNAHNNPGDSWVASMGNDADIVVNSWAESAGAAWTFVEVAEEDALKLINDYIVEFKTYSVSTISNYSGDNVNPAKVAAYVDAINDIISTSATTADAMEQLRTLYSLATKARYDIFALPVVTAENEALVNPKWYYIRNVESEQYYANYAGGKNYMSLIDGTVDGAKKLSNLFYLANEDGTAENANNVDEHLLVHIHNFRALNDSVLLAKNTNVGQATNVTRTDEKKSTVTVLSDLGITAANAWRIAFEVASDGTNLNAYGSCYLAAVQGENETLGDNFPEGFQLYFRADRTLAVRVGHTNGYDSHRFTHLDGAFSNIKFVLTYGGGNLKIEVTNDAGVTQSVELSCSFRNGIKDLYAALPMTGVTITNITVDKIDAMKWDQHTTDKRDWYVLPSSNVDFPGLAIVMDGADDNNLGWTNYRTEDNMVFMDAGNADYSSWQFEKVTDFDDHVDELLEGFNLEDCVIYNKELAHFYNLIISNRAEINAEVDGENEEELFNELYRVYVEFMSNPNAPKPEDYKAPKPGKLYTIRSFIEENTENALLVHVDAANNGLATLELNNADVVRDDYSYDSRAAWVFEGTADGEFLELTGLKAKNIHTQCYITALGDESSVLGAEGSEITLQAIENYGGITQFKVGSAYMNRTNGSATISYNKNADNFWGCAIETPAYLSTVISGASLGDGNVHCKSTGVKVDAEGDVAVTFTYTGGNHKINILGVELVDECGRVVYKNYAYLAAGSPPNDVKTYTLTAVAAGEYTLNCYVYDPFGSGKDDLTETVGNFVITGVAEVSGGAKVTNTGTETTKWIIEEIENPQESVYHLTNTAQHGHGTLKLGFPALIPTGVEAFHAKVHGDIRDDRYISMVSYGEPTDETRILPSNTAVMLRNVNGEAATKEFKFYYSENDATPVPDNYIHGVLYNTIIDCSSYDTTDFDGDGKADGDVNIYMLQASKNTAKLYWIYEERSADGTIKDGNANTDNGGYIICKANRAFMVLPKIQVAETTSFSLRFGGGETTDIEDVIEEGSDVEIIESIYDLQGRRLDEITEPGIYIINGKKVFIK